MLKESISKLCVYVIHIYSAPNAECMQYVRVKRTHNVFFIPIPYVRKALHQHLAMTYNIRLKLTFYIRNHNVSSQSCAHWVTIVDIVEILDIVKKAMEHTRGKSLKKNLVQFSKKSLKNPKNL